MPGPNEAENCEIARHFAEELAIGLWRAGISATSLPRSIMNVAVTA
jgi:hypothetical protein